MIAATSTYAQAGTPPELRLAITSRNVTWLTNWIPVETPESRPRWCNGAMSGNRAAYGSAATLKKRENRTMAAASGTRLLAPAAATQNSADSGTPASRNGRRLPIGVQVRSEKAPMVG